MTIEEQNILALRRLVHKNAPIVWREWCYKHGYAPRPYKSPEIEKAEFFKDKVYEPVHHGKHYECGACNHKK